MRFFLAAFVALLLPAMATALPGPRGSWGRANTFCHMVATSGGRSRFLSFLWRRPDGAPPVLVQSAWDARGGRLRECAARAEPSITGSYSALCAQLPPPRPGRDPRRSGPDGSRLERAFWGPELRRALAVLEARRGSCKGLEAATWRAVGGPEAAPGRRRVRRGWTMPGTLWCGAGDSAGNFSELGVFQGPDVCCREHDQCEAQIPGLGYGYGMRNFRLHTISHCDCDKRFRECLMNQNDTISNFVGATYFTYLEIPCFTLEESEECKEWHWWGGCKTYGPMPLAHLVQQSQYDSIPAFSEKSGPVAPPPRPERRKGKGKKHRQRNQKHLEETTKGQRWQPERSRVQTSTTPLISVSEPNLIPNSPITKGTVLLLPSLGATTVPGLSKMGVAPGTDFPGTQQTYTGPAALPDAGVQGGKTVSGTPGREHTTTPSNLASPQSCSCYHRLDQCPYRILPYEVKYQLHNQDSRTLFHCNCTRRLARFLRKTKGPNEVEGEVLLDYVSSACFVLQTPPGCREGEEEEPNCIDVGQAVLAPARHLTNRLSRKHWRPSLKVKRQERTPPNRPLLLFEKCLQLAQAAHHSGPH
ncbi:hypothetical protein lerEdw1_003543 [Lerista edwardsae]|nr:hypothetical protein lerEdw1_003543 [Lerista edwardsae]